MNIQWGKLKRTNATTNEFYNERCYNERMLQRTNSTTNECHNERCYNEQMLQRTNSTTNERYNERMLQRTNSTTNECYNERMPQRTMLQRTYATTNECYNERILQRMNATTNECYNERMLQRRVFTNKIRIIKRKQSNLDSLCKKMDKRPPKDGPPTGHSPKVSRNDDSCPSIFVWFFMIFIRESLFIVLLRKDSLCFSNLHVQCIKVKLILYCFYTYIFSFCIIFFLFKWLCWR